MTLVATGRAGEHVRSCQHMLRSQPAEVQLCLVSALHFNLDVMSGMKEQRLRRGERARAYCGERLGAFNCVHVHEGVSHHVMGAVERLLSTFEALMQVFNLFKSGFM